MGSMTSTPKVPPRTTQQQVVYVPAPVQTANVTPAPELVQEAAAESRATSLLARDRGRFGTILTGFRGFLGTKDNGVQRKTLLGE